MRFYQYKAKDVRGYSCGGTLKAESEEAARLELARRRLDVLEIEEDLEASSRVSKETLAIKTPRVKRSIKLQEFLSYAMPAAAAIIAICGIPLMLHFVKPVAPDKPPIKVLEEYFHLESAAQFEKQYTLLSREKKKNYPSAKDYAKQRRQSFTSIGSANPLVPGKGSGFKEIEKKARKVRYEVKILRPTGVETGEAQLTLSQGKWGIDSLRDPAVIHDALDRILATQDEAKRRVMTVALKRESGHSDLEIAELLKKRRQSNRNQELGGEAYLL